MVFVGYDYADVISEHGNTVIPSDAINLLSLSP